MGKSMASPWLGFGLGTWLRVLKANRFKVHPAHLHRTVGITAASSIHSVLALVEKALFSGKIDAVDVSPDPVFIIGHWRCGTTYLHELLAHDPNHTFPNTYECFDPTHFVLTEGSTDKLLRFTLPDSRPMDNMKVGFERPQEDEFALCGMGLPSPYRMLAFPNNPGQFEHFLDLDNLPEEDQQKWKAGLHRLFRRVLYQRPGRIVVKSPSHSFRIRHLLQLFPDARFIHVVRNPYRVLPSTIHLWKSLCENWALQKPDFSTLEEQVLRVYNSLYEKLGATLPLIPPENLYQVKFEDLIETPMPIMEDIYGKLRLGDFADAAPHMQTFLNSVADYKTNLYHPDPRLAALVDAHWSHIVTRYGYPPAGHMPQGTRTLTVTNARVRCERANGERVRERFTSREAGAEQRRDHPIRGAQGFTVFFTGLSGSGKSTVANVLMTRLLEIGGRSVTLLDGDIVRKSLSPELGFSKEHRDINIARIGHLAEDITKAGGCAICAAIAPYNAARKANRRRISREGGYLLVHMSTPVQVCEQRDSKGLYAKARAGIIKGFTGISDPYEVPDDADITIDTTNMSAPQSAEIIIDFLKKQGYLN